MQILWVNVTGPGWLQMDLKVLDDEDRAGRVAVSKDPHNPSARVGRFLAKTDLPYPYEKRHRKHDDVCPVLHPDPDDEPPAAVQPALLPDDLSTPGANP